MSKITNDGLTRSDTGCFIISVPIWQQRASKLLHLTIDEFCDKLELSCGNWTVAKSVGQSLSTPGDSNMTQSVITRWPGGWPSGLVNVPRNIDKTLARSVASPRWPAIITTPPPSAAAAAAGRPA